MKKCSFKKEYISTHIDLYGTGFPVADYQEFFTDCIKEECMAYHINILTDMPCCSLLNFISINNEEEENG